MTSPLLVSWPMYASDAAAVAAFWADLGSAMREVGIVGVPDELTHPADLVAHWCDPALLLSQTCGYPFTTQLTGRVRYLATPRFGVDGCEGATYRSAIVVRRDEPAAAIQDLFGRRVAFNSRDSHSGYNVLRFMVAPHARGGRFFSAAIETGGHRASLAAVRDNRADIAAIDAVSLAHLQGAAAAECDGIRVLQQSPGAPGLPLVTSLDTDAPTVTLLRMALVRACDPLRPAAAGLKLDGLAILDEKAYQPIREMQNRAETLGYPELT